MIQGLGSAWISGAQYHSTASRNAATPSAGGNMDSLSISQTARALSAKEKGNLSVPASAANPIPESTTQTFAIASSRLHAYANLGLGTGETNLTAMNFSRKSLGSKVESILKTAGIKLGKDEKVSMSVGADNKIKVAGIKDKKKAEAIEKALNEDKKLGRDLRNHVAVGRVTQNAKKQEDYVEFLKDNGMEVPEDIDELFTHSGIRAFILDDYLQEEAGVGLDALGLQTEADGSETLTGVNQIMAQLFSDDPSLEATLKSMIKDGKTDTSFSVSFEYANGALSDPTSLDMAKNKVQSIRNSIMGFYDKETKQMVPGAIDELRETVEKNGGGIDDPALQEALSRGFAIKVDRSGKFEIVGDNLSAKSKQILENIVQKALDGWAADESRTALDGRGGKRVANFADVAETYIEEHRFEHGDVDEHGHEVIINFAGSVNDTKVVSEAADNAQDEKNKELAGELGNSLRQMLGEKGIDAANMSMEIDENGKITVSGDADPQDLQKAQQLIDAFVKDAKKGGNGSADDESEHDGKLNASEINQNAQTERLKMHYGKKDEDYTPEGWAKRDVVTTSDVAPEVVETEEEERRRNLAYTTEQRKADLAKSYAANLPGVKQDDHLFNGIVSGGVSNIKKSRFTAEESDGVGQRFNVGGNNPAAAMYRELMGGMQFHDPWRTAKYAM